MAYLPGNPNWIKITKLFSDFSTAGLTNSINIFSLPAKGVIHAVFLNPTTLFSGGIIASYTISVGISGTPAKYNAAANVFTGAGLPTPTAGIFVENMSGSTNIQATSISTVGNLNAATAGSVDIYILISLLN